MTRSGSIFLLADAALVLLATVLLAGCGSGGGSARADAQPVNTVSTKKRPSSRAFSVSRGRDSTRGPSITSIWNARKTGFQFGRHNRSENAARCSAFARASAARL
jgi:hypothetical protein